MLFVENSVEVVEHVAEVTQKLAANVAKKLPEDGSLHKVVEEIEHIAEVVDVDAEKVEAITEKVCVRSLIFLLIVRYSHAISISILQLNTSILFYKLYHCKVLLEQKPSTACSGVALYVRVFYPTR